MYKCWFSSTPIRIPNTKKDHKNCDFNLLRSFWTPNSFFVDYPIFGVDSLCRLFFVQEKYTKKHFLKCIVSGSFCLQGIKLVKPRFWNISRSATNVFQNRGLFQYQGPHFGRNFWKILWVTILYCFYATFFLDFQIFKRTLT